MEITTSITWIVMILIATLWQAEQVKNNGYTDNPGTIMNLAQEMLAGRTL
jgi:hypothetical protein